MEWVIFGALVLVLGSQFRLILSRLRTVRAPSRREKQLRQLELALPGAEPDNPVSISSPAVVEPKAKALVCVQCGNEHRLLEHAAITVSGQRLRKATAECVGCGRRRELYLRLETEAAEPGTQLN